MNWVSAALPYVGGGLLDAGLTYALTWFRERRRTLDAYRAPQREAIGEIVTAAHQFLMREVETRFLFTEFVERLRQRPDEIPPNGGQLMPSMGVMQAALLNVERAFQIGALSIVDAKCWAALRIAYTELTRLRNYFISEADREFRIPTSSINTSGA
jgi:hypothetical protein